MFVSAAVAVTRGESILKQDFQVELKRNALFLHFQNELSFTRNKLSIHKLCMPLYSSRISHSLHFSLFILLPAPYQIRIRGYIPGGKAAGT
jgi:hypothetical protein